MLLWKLRNPKTCSQQAGDPGADGIVPESEAPEKQES